mgnify:FL=1
MIIEHIAMYVSSLDCAKDFFIKYFNAKCGKLYYNEKTGFRSYFLTFGFGARLEIMNKPGISVSDNLNKTGYAHIAFRLESKKRVDELTGRLRNDGFEIISGPRITGDGYYESAFFDLEGNIIELTI